MQTLLVSLLAIGVLTAPLAAQNTADRVGFVTTLGRDTVVLESVTRSASRVEGRIVVRIPGTVLMRYVMDLGSDGTVTKSFLETVPLGSADVLPRKVTLQVRRDSVRVDIDSAGTRTSVTRPLPPGTPPLFMTGFGSSYGLYSSLGMYELMLSRVPVSASDTTTIVAVGASSGRTAPRRFIRRAASDVSVDYFGVLWTHLKVDSAGRIVSADAIETTEKTRSTRSAFMDVERAAKEYAALDRKGKGLGVASPDTLIHTTLGSAKLTLEYGSPRKRDREILGNIVHFGRVWRTGANAASALTTNRELVIGGKTVPVGIYTLFTLPKRDGVELIINRQIGQWGTSYDSSQDLVRIPMQVTTAHTPRENFAISITGSGASGQLRIEWDTFVWSVPVQVK